ncbi:3-keto-disaccharide hydrolase [Sphingobacterium wenxiniae]|uniref:3-keto-alpha-glucoside-1,2-lyase/3-keto-2-hydroxy-glucal hydratase domain-containing protein n=1 Tax=Sphingobacterium wenxiniae TaxID=683125 RepID=A0A1I6UJF8_9SPHI|nr:DUF1080 domain-containing protein [Sphingobacterium wenxiniae]SFT01606.1 protein of unknown function [Sphingobacterium wenxiniae]
MRIIALFLICLQLIACTTTEKQNTLSATEQEENWQLLFDGQSLQGWHIYNKGTVESKWVAHNGELVCDPKKKESIFGDLVTDKTYQDFELKLEWKVNRGGNSGIFVNVMEDSIYAATFATGLEMQLLDNENAEKRHQIDSTHWAGCLYAVDCIASNSKPRPYGQWNESRIVQKNGKVSFWLNGKLTFEQETQIESFQEMVKSSGMKAYPDFAKYPSGKIALQNHTDSIAFRNIKIREL